MKTAIGYIRVSSEDQADSGLRLEAPAPAHPGLLRAQGPAPGRDLGGPRRIRRQGPLDPVRRCRLLALARKSKLVVVGAKFDWLFRSAGDAALAIADFDRRDIELAAIAESFDMTNPFAGPWPR